MYHPPYRPSPGPLWSIRADVDVSVGTRMAMGCPWRGHLSRSGRSGISLGHLWRPLGDTHGIACDRPTAADAVRENGAFLTVRSAGAWEKTPGYHFCDNQSDNQGHPPTQNRGGMYHPPGVAQQP